jgi:hypothetical protein
MQFSKSLERYTWESGDIFIRGYTITGRLKSSTPSNLKKYKTHTNFKNLN